MLFRLQTDEEFIANGYISSLPVYEDPQATADAELGRAVQAAVRSGHVDSQYLDEWAGAIEAESGHSCANDPALNILRAVAAVLKPRERQNATHD